MTKQPRNAVIASFALAKEKIIVLLITEVCVTLLMILLSSVLEKMRVFAGSDLPAIILIFILGMDFYEDHSAFCKASALSLREKVISQCVVVGAVCLFVADFDRIASRAVLTVPTASLSEFFRMSVSSYAWTEKPIASSILESTFFFIMVYSAGYYIGCVRSTKNQRAAISSMLTVLIIVGSGTAIGFCTWINPISWVIGTPCAMLLRSNVTTVLLYAIAAAILMFSAHKVAHPSRRVHKAKEEQA